MTIAHVYNEHDAYKTTISLKSKSYETVHKVTTLLVICLKIFLTAASLNVARSTQLSTKTNPK